MTLALLMSACARSGGSSSPSSSNNSSDDSTTSSEPDEPVENLEDYLIANLDFSNEGNLGLDVSGHDNNAAIVSSGGLTIDSGTHLGKSVLKFNNTSHEANYLDLSNISLAQKDITITSWVYVPYPIETFNNGSPLFSIKTTDGDYIYSSPYDTSCWFGYSINVLTNGVEKSLTRVDPSTATHWQNTPVNGTIQSVAGEWHLIGFEFTEEKLSVYYNGLLMYDYEDYYSFKYKTIKEFRIGSTGVTSVNDFNGMISDFRIYSKALSEKDYQTAYEYTYDNFLTTNFEFNESYVDSQRGLVATPTGGVSFKNKDGRQCVYLDGQGNAPSNKSSINLPQQILLGHNKITISTDVYIINTGNLYQRIFEFSIGGARFFALYVGFAQTNNLKLEYAPDSEKARDVVLDSGYTVPTDTWINITVVADGQVGKLYVDGHLISENLEFKYDPVIMYYWPDLHCTLGRTDFYGDKPVNGYYDNFKMWSVPLSEKDIMMLNGLITIDDDEAAIRQEMGKFSLQKERELQLILPKYADEGVRLTYKSMTPELLDDMGALYPINEVSSATLQVTFSRGDCSMTKEFEVSVPKRTPGVNQHESSSLDQVQYDDETYFNETMLVNLDYLFTLDTERLLYNYRLNAGLSTGSAISYGGWIATRTGGAGQFESQYVGALARYTLSQPDYVSSVAPEATNTPYKRLKYMLQEMRKCQVAYGEKYPEEFGYLSAFTHLCMEAIENGSSTVDGGDGIHGTVPVGGVNAWVPFYMYHKNLMMCYDVYTYVKDADIKALALQMLRDAGIWAFNEISSLSQTQRANVLNVEYGGMSEVMYLTYGITNDYRFLRVARFFEEESMLKALYNNQNIFPYKHANTNIPKILACCAAYNVLGDEYYKQIAINAWNMIAEHMTYANGGVSLNEGFEEADVTTQGCYGEETCCAYNMLRLTDYIFNWCGEKKYADYFENTFYNQIMASIDPITGGKTYPISTTFGYYKIYSSAENSFWCCCSTGQESFAKLNWGTYYKNATDGSVSINMFNASTYQDGDKKIFITGNLFTDELVHLSVQSSDPMKLRFRVPHWCSNMTLKLNGEAFTDYTVENGYVIINRIWAQSDDLIIYLPMDYYFVAERGYENYRALFYGPLLLVASLCDVDPSECIGNDQTKNGTYGGVYTGQYTQLMAFADGEDNYKSHITKSVVNGKLVFMFAADNQTIKFVPFMDCYHSRFSMYMAYQFNFSEIHVEGTKHNVETSSAAMFSRYASGGSISYGTSGISMSGGEQKLIINGQKITGNYEVEFTLTAATTGGSVNAGMYLGASGAGAAQDAIKALNVHVERSKNSNTWTVNIFKFNQAYLGFIGRVGVDMTGDTITLRAVVLDGYLHVFVNGSAYPILSCPADSSWTDGRLGIRNQGDSAAIISNISYTN